MLQETTNAAPSLKTLRIIVAFSCFLVMLLSAAAIIIGSIAETTTPEYLNGLPVMRVIHLVVTLAVIASTNFIASKVLAGKIKLRSGSRATNLTPQTSAFFQRYMQANIIKIALYEMAAIFGAVIFIYASTSGAVKSDPTYYLHFLPLFFFLIQAWKMYPTEQKYIDLEKMYTTNN